MKPLKTVTFSYDDGVTQDERLIALLNRYGMKATFNLNSGFLGQRDTLNVNGTVVNQFKVSPDRVREVYQGHEVASHTLTHPFLPDLPEEEIVRQVEADCDALTELTGQAVHGFAYPCGGQNFDRRVSDILRRRTRIRYGRTTVSSYGFEYPKDPMTLHPTAHHGDWARLDALADRWLALMPEKPQLFYIWGHAYEFDADDSWGCFERFLGRIAGRADTAYLTNAEALSLADK